MNQFLSDLPEYILIELAIITNDKNIISNHKKGEIGPFVIDKQRMNQVDISFNIPPGEMQNFYNGIDLLLMPHPSKAISLTVIESMYCGTPVIRFGYKNRYPIINNKTGFLINSTSYDLIQCLENASENKNQLKEISKSAHRIISDEFTNKHVMSSLEKVYESLIQ